jgi:hypothetical protein
MVVTFMKSTKPTGRWGVVVLCVASAGSLAACGGSAGSTGQSTTTSGVTAKSALHASPRIDYGSGSVGPQNPTTTVPQNGNRPIPPIFGAGQNVIISKQGCYPQTIEASVTAPVVWTNFSGEPQRIIFDHFPVDSGTIPVGGTFTWSTNQAIVFNYELEPSGKICKVAMNAA